MDRLNSRMKRTEKRISELENGIMEITQQNNREKIDNNKNTRHVSTGMCGNINKRLTFVSLDKKKIKRQGWKNYSNK